MSDRPEFPEMMRRFGGEPEPSVWDTLAPRRPKPAEDAPKPLPTEMGQYVIKGGTSVNRWAATVYCLGPNGRWYQTLPLVEVEPAEIYQRLFEGQELEQMVPKSKSDM